MVLKGEFGCEVGDNEAALNKADGAEDGARGEVAIRAVNHFGADDEDRNIGAAQDGFSYGPDKNLADRAGRMGAHDNAIDVTLAEISEDLIGGETGTHHHIALDSGVTGSLREGIQMLDVSAGSGG